ncbi:metallophosphoesterase [Intestinibacter sp.]
MAIYITGDTHGGNDEQKLYDENFPNYENCTKDDYLIVLGDWGYMFRYNPSGVENDDEFLGVDDEDLRSELVLERKRLYNITNKNYTTLVLLGNHDNYDRIDSLPVINMFGGKVRKFNDKVFILMRGEVYDIEGYKFFAFSGAYSLDKAYRTPKKTWWEQEECTSEEEEYALKNLSKQNNKVDFILTHTCSESTLKYLLQIKCCFIEHYDNQNRFFEKIKQNINYKYWFMGHMHQDYRLNEKEFLVYNKVLNLDQIQKQDEEIPYERFTFK